MAAPTEAIERQRRKRGTGTIVPRRNGFEAAIQINGKRQTKLFATYNEAERWLDELVRARDADSRPQESNELSYWIKQWLGTKAGTKRETRQKAESETKLLTTVMGHLRVMDITAEHITMMWQLLAPPEPSHRVPNTSREPRKPGSDSEWEAICTSAKVLGLKPASEGRPDPTLGTANKLTKTYRHLKNALELAKANGVLASNVADNKRVKPGKRRTSEAVRAWTPQEVRRLLQTASGHEYHPLFFLALSTGIRIGEACALHWRDVSLERNEITVIETGDGTSQPEDGATAKTQASYRIVPIENDSRAMLLRIRAQQAVTRSENGKRYRDRGLVFAGPQGGALSKKDVNKTLKGWCRSSEVQELTFHATRHTYVSLARRAGIQIEHISKRIGHASVEYTQKIYRHIYPDEGTDKVLSVNQMLEYGPSGFRQPDGPPIDPTELTDLLTGFIIEELRNRDVDPSANGEVVEAAAEAVARTVSHVMNPNRSPSPEDTAQLVVTSGRDAADSRQTRTCTLDAEAAADGPEEGDLKRVA